MVSFLGVKSGCILAFERGRGGFREGTADIIRLLWSDDLLIIRMRSLLERCIIPVVPFSPTQECINPGERIKKSNANLRFAENECTGNGEKSKSLFSRLSLTPRTLDHMQ
jgi:hypothetical protein